MNKALIIGALLTCIIVLPDCQQEQFGQGKRIYEVNCSNCHMADGQGLGTMYPAIHNSPYLTTLRSDLPCLIINGKKGQIMENVSMPANKNLTPVGINNLMNYLSHTWGDGTISNLNDITAQMESCD